MPLILPILLNNLQTRQHLVKTLLTQKSRCAVGVKLLRLFPRSLRLSLLLDRPVDLQVHQEYLDLEFQGRTLSKPCLLSCAQGWECPASGVQDLQSTGDPLKVEVQYIEI